MVNTHKTIYYGGMMPSKDFDEYEYQAYLNSASLYELENDIVTKETLDKIAAAAFPTQNEEKDPEEVKTDDEEEILRAYAARWYNGDEDPRVAKVLEAVLATIPVVERLDKADSCAVIKESAYPFVDASEDKTGVGNPVIALLFIAGSVVEGLTLLKVIPVPASSVSVKKHDQFAFVRL